MDNKTQNELTIDDKVKELVSLFSGKKADSGDDKTKKIKQPATEKTADPLQDSIDYLRICIMYQVFDVEATRRENEYLRNVLKELSDNNPGLGGNSIGG